MNTHYYPENFSWWRWLSRRTASRGKSWLVAFLIASWTTVLFAEPPKLPALIPAPQAMAVSAGVFKLNLQTQICTDSKSQPDSEFLIATLHRSTGFNFNCKIISAADPILSNSICLTLEGADTNLGAEGYELLVTTNSIVIRAPQPAGIFYGVQTLLQLFPPEIFSTNLVTKTDWQIPCVDIQDWPRFSWRGQMLDVSRHFYTKAEVETLLDLMAMHKLNVFHWHLVDNQGWRIEIKKYPKLTRIGAWRKGIGWNLDPQASTAYNANGKYGGFYTQDDIREVVAYAAARHILIVPEIELPGHSSAALSAYPQFGDYGTNGSANHNVYNPANPETFRFLEDVLTEVFALFPGKYIHIGGDEVSKADWKNSPECQALMRREGLKNEEELQSWFIRRIETFVNANGKTLIGWSEILQGGLAQNAVVMDWIGGGKEAATEGHDVVMTPLTHCYLNYYQVTNTEHEPHAPPNHFISLEKVYAFDPIPTNLSTAFQSHILGAQGCMWTEWIAGFSHAEYMLFPRLCALSEVVWSAPAARNWPDFQRRLAVHEKRLGELGVNYHHEATNETPAISTARVTTDFINAEISLEYPGFTGLSLDSLGKEHFPAITINPPAKPWTPTRATQLGSRVEYRRPDDGEAATPRWAIEIHTNEIILESHWSAADPPEPLVFEAENKISHATLLGRFQPDGAISLPAILHFPDQGSFRISCPTDDHASLGYEIGSGDLFLHQPTSVKIIFRGATQSNPAVKYRWETVAIHPPLAEAETDVRFDAFRRNWLNIFQLSPRTRTLANHAASDTCAFCYYEYADVARLTPPLAKGLTALDLVRQTLDAVIAGTNAYGLPARSHIHDFSADTIPSLLIAAEDYFAGSQDDVWLTANYSQLQTWTEKMLATDRAGNGLIEYSLSGNSGSWPPQFVLRPANWWDTIGFGHEDAYANALAYRALRGLEQLAHSAHHPADQTRYHAAADKLKAAYFKTFYNPATGVLAGWRSADGQLHDYYFLWVNGIAIHYGLVPVADADKIMDRLLAKMKTVGYTRFDLGLPGNLIPVAKKDYVNPNLRWGGGTKEDNSDGFQQFENGGATACYEYFTLAALYDLRRPDEADAILFPLLKSFAQGNFQGHDAAGRALEWKKWDGSGCGYEGFLTDNYYALLAVTARAAAKPSADKNTPDL